MGAREIVDGALEAAVVPSFSRLGPAVRRRLFDWHEPPPMHGRTVLVTGATSGLGLEAARRLALLGARVLVLGRDTLRVDAAVASLPGARGYVADMSSLASVRDVAGRVAAEEPGLDVLVHNAGALLSNRRESADGLEMTFATMVLGPFLLTSLLRPMLEASRGRVVWVSSGGMYLQRLCVNDVEFRNESYRGTEAYARAKRAQVVLSELWARALRDRGVVSHAMHPGWADTPGLEAGLPGFRRLMGPLLRDAASGADTIVWLAASREAGRSTGRFWLDRRPRRTHRWPGTRETAADRAALWEVCMRLTGAEAVAAR
jgi:NAD(P)-dependent dehydrogenase (short-subunit alcohol dehydrogenase family)